MVSMNCMHMGGHGIGEREMNGGRRVLESSEMGIMGI